MRQMFFLVYKKKKLSILPEYSSNTDSKNMLFLCMSTELTSNLQAESVSVHTS